MDELREWFEKDCGEMDTSRPPFDFYALGYYRAKIEELENGIKGLETELQKRENMGKWNEY